MTDRLVENEKQRTRGILNQIADIQAAAVSSWVRAALGDATGIRQRGFLKVFVQLLR
jgi:hypothetical protein